MSKKNSLLNPLVFSYQQSISWDSGRLKKQYKIDLFQSLGVQSQDKTLYRKNLKGHFGCVNAIEFSKNGGQFIASGGDDRRVLLWDVEKSLNNVSRPVAMREQHHSNIFCLEFDNENKKIISGGNDQLVIAHDIESGRNLDVFFHEDAVYCLAVDPNNSMVFGSACDDGRILIYDIRQPASEDPFVLATSPDPMHSLCFNPVDPRFIVTANSGEGTQLWDIRVPRKPLHKYGSRHLHSGHRTSMSVCFNRLGTHLMALRRQRGPVVFDVADSLPPVQFEGDGYRNFCTMKSCTFAGENDEYVISGSDDFKLYMWKIPTDEKVEKVTQTHCTLEGHRSIVNQVRYNPQSCLIISSGVEKIVKVWSPLPIGDLKSDECKAEIPRAKFTTLQYIGLVMSDGNLDGDISNALLVTHNYNDRSTEEDSRMLAFFDSLVDRERTSALIESDVDDDDDDDDDEDNNSGVMETRRRWRMRNAGGNVDNAYGLGDDHFLSAGNDDVFRYLNLSELEEEASNSEDAYDDDDDDDVTNIAGDHDNNDDDRLVNSSRSRRRNEDVNIFPRIVTSVATPAATDDSSTSSSSSSSSTSSSSSSSSSVDTSSSNSGSSSNSDGRKGELTFNQKREKIYSSDDDDDEDDDDDDRGMDLDSTSGKKNKLSNRFVNIDDDEDDDEDDNKEKEDDDEDADNEFKSFLRNRRRKLSSSSSSSPSPPPTPLSFTNALATASNDINKSTLSKSRTYNLSDSSSSSSPMTSKNVEDLDDDGEEDDVGGRSRPNDAKKMSVSRLKLSPKFSRRKKFEFEASRSSSSRSAIATTPTTPRSSRANQSQSLIVSLPRLMSDSSNDDCCADCNDASSTHNGASCKGNDHSYNASLNGHDRKGEDESEVIRQSKNKATLSKNSNTASIHGATISSISLYNGNNSSSSSSSHAKLNSRTQSNLTTSISNCNDDKNISSNSLKNEVGPSSSDRLISEEQPVEKFNRKNFHSRKRRYRHQAGRKNKSRNSFGADDDDGNDDDDDDNCDDDDDDDDGVRRRGFRRHNGDQTCGSNAANGKRRKFEPQVSEENDDDDDDDNDHYHRELKSIFKINYNDGADNDKRLYKTSKPTCTTNNGKTAASHGCHQNKRSGSGDRNYNADACNSSLPDKNGIIYNKSTVNSNIDSTNDDKNYEEKPAELMNHLMQASHVDDENVHKTTGRDHDEDDDVDEEAMEDATRHTNVTSLLPQLTAASTTPTPHMLLPQSTESFSYSYCRDLHHEP